MAENNVAGYNRYLDRFPHGAYVHDAIERLRDLEDDQEWERAGRIDVVFAYQTYLHLFPQGRNAVSARTRIQELERREINKTGKIIPPVGVRPQQVKARSLTQKAQPKQAKATPLTQKAQPMGFIPKHTEENAFTDPRDGQVYRTVKLNGLVWLAQNLNFDVGEGCWFYDNDPKNGEKYGRLYTWEAAQRACPSGWRLPTDAEWRKMAKLFGGCDADAKDGGKAAYEALIGGGKSGFSVLLGSFRHSDGRFYSLGDSGSYWSATESSWSGAWYYSFYRNTGELYRGSDYKASGLSCRCVQD